MYQLALGTFAVAMFSWTSVLGPARALWKGWPIALLLLPCWVMINLGSVEVNARVVAGAVVLAALVWRAVTAPLVGAALLPGHPAPARLLPSDVLVALLVASQIISEFLAGDLRPLTVPSMLVQWVLPYAVGRGFLTRGADVGPALRATVPCLLILAAYGVVECLTKFNVANYLFGKSFFLLDQGEGFRYGLRRAQGMTGHPINLGMLLVLSLPWALEASRRARSGAGPGWWRVLPSAVVIGVASTLSRGPVLAAVAAALVALFFAHRRLRAPLLALALCGTAGAIACQDVILEALNRVAGENEAGAEMIVIDGDEVAYTGTNHRILLFRVYRDAIANAGPFGYGYLRRGVELDEWLLKFWSIDDHYILILLQYGYSGLVLFSALSLVVLGQLLYASYFGDWDCRGLAGALFGSMLAVGIALFSVYLSPDFGTAWLFCAGLAGNLRCLAGAGRGPA